MAQTTSDATEPAKRALEALHDRATWQPGSMIRVISRVSGGVRSIASSIPLLESEWHRIAVEALDRPDSFWVILGDSTAQGVGASTIDHTWVARLEAALRVSGRPHGVVNLARSGARASDVVKEQLPIIDLLPEAPALVCCVVGTNDLMRNPAPPVVAGRLRRLLEGLPSGSAVATLPSPGASPSGRWINRALRQSAADNGHLIADLTPHLIGFRGLAADRFHPSDRGYDAWVTAFAGPLGLDRAAVPTVGSLGVTSGQPGP